MYTTREEVGALTGSDVAQSMLFMAQSIIEMYTGRTEARVEDPDDLMLLRQATAYQAVYMAENPEQVFAQVGAKQLQQDSFSITLWDSDSPMISPLAAMACRRLSWARTRSISTAPNRRRRFLPDWWTD